MEHNKNGIHVCDACGAFCKIIDLTRHTYQGNDKLECDTRYQGRYVGICRECDKRYQPIKKA